MKQTILIISALFLSFSSFAQDCFPTSYVNLDANKVSARIDPSGSLFWNGEFSNYEVGAFNDIVTTIFAQGLWIGGVSPSGEALLSAATYGKSQSQFDFYPGALEMTSPNEWTITDEACQFWNQVWTVSGVQISNHIQDYEDNGVIDNQQDAIFQWPARGNAYLDWPVDYGTQSLAPFIDRDADGIYEPDQGDYPYLPQANVIPSQMTWCVFNTVGGPANDSHSASSPSTEIQLLSWSFACENDPLIDNTIFLSYKLINKSVEAIEDTRIAFWHDFDLGCYTDDLIGCSPEQNTFFVYNSTNLDANCPGGFAIHEAGLNPPVQAVTILNQNMDYFISSANSSVGSVPPAMADPTSPSDYLNYMNGLYRDGTPITPSGNGYNPGSTAQAINYLYTGNPNNSGDWAEIFNPFGAIDQRTISTIALDEDFAPGAIVQVDLAYSYHRAEGASFLGNVEVMYDNVDLLQADYNNSFEGVCGLPLSVDTQLDANQLSIYPNPVEQILYLSAGELELEAVQLWDNYGRLLSTRTDIVNQIDLSGVSAGVYYLKIQTTKGWLTKKFVKID